MNRLWPSSANCSIASNNPVVDQRSAWQWLIGNFWPRGAISICLKRKSSSSTIAQNFIEDQHHSCTHCTERLDADASSDHGIKLSNSSNQNCTRNGNKQSISALELGFSAQIPTEQSKFPLHLDTSSANAVCSSQSSATEAMTMGTNMAQLPTHESEDEGPFAFVTVVFGTNPGYCIEAAVLGESLRLSGTHHALLLLHTSDVPVEWLRELQAVGWELHEVEYLEARGLYVGGQRGRFANVFTKLRVLSLIEYKKIVLLDTDLLVRKNVDHLFKRPTPSALRRHAAADFPDNAKIDGAEFYDSNGNQTSGINAGVVVLQPSVEDFAIICNEISDESHPEHHKSRMPEQDYLTRFYVDQWYALGVQYNYQVHQIAFTDRGGLEQCSRLAVDYGDLFIVHFSACPKPRDLLVNPDYDGMSKTHFADSVLCRTYLEGMVRDRRRGSNSARGAAAIEAQLRSVTWSSALQWFDVWEQLIERLPDLAGLVAAGKTSALQLHRRQLKRRRSSSGSSCNSHGGCCNGHIRLRGRRQNLSERRQRRKCTKVCSTLIKTTKASE